MKKAQKQELRHDPLNMERINRKSVYIVHTAQVQGAIGMTVQLQSSESLLSLGKSSGATGMTVRLQSYERLLSSDKNSAETIFGKVHDVYLWRRKRQSNSFSQCTLG